MDASSLLHHTALGLQLVCTSLLAGAHVQTHIALLIQVQELLKKLLHVGVGLGRCFHERAFPDVCLSFALLGLHLALGLIALVAHKHDGDVLHVTFDGQHLLVYGLQLLQRLPAGDGVDQDEGVAFGDGQTLHSRELVTASGVGDLQSAYALVTADDLPVCVLHRRDVGVPEGAFNEAQNQGALAHSPCSKHHHPVIVTLLWHAAWVCWSMWRLRLNYSLRSEKGKRFNLVHMHIETVSNNVFIFCGSQTKRNSGTFLISRH